MDHEHLRRPLFVQRSSELLELIVGESRMVRYISSFKDGEAFNHSTHPNNQRSEIYSNQHCEMISEESNVMK